MKQLVMMASSLRCSDQGWTAVLNKVQESIEGVPISFRLVNYYLETEETTAIRRQKL
jgi:hypothetical protein